MCFYVIHLQLLHQYGILVILKFKVVSSSKDALIVNNMYGYCENYEVFSYSLQKIMYCIYNGKFYSHAVIINSLVI